jgi:hypothetical protein
VTKTVTFENQGALESVLTFPVLGKANVADAPVRLEVTAVGRRPLRVAPDRLSLSAAGFPLTRRLLVAVDALGPAVQNQLQCASDVGGVTASVKPASSGKAFLVELILPADYPDRLQSAGQDTLHVGYGGHRVAAPVVVN